MQYITISSNLGHNFFGVVGLVFAFLYLMKFYKAIGDAHFNTAVSALTVLIGLTYLLGLIVSSDFSRFGEINNSVTQHILLALVITFFGVWLWIKRTYSSLFTKIQVALYISIGSIIVIHNHQTGHDVLFGDAYHRLLAALSIWLACLHAILDLAKLKRVSLFALNSACFWLIGVLLFIYKTSSGH